MSDVVAFRAKELRRGEHVVLRDVDLHLQRGGFHCIIGANGTGKTSLLRAMCGDPIPGVDLLTIDGHETKGLDAAHLAELRAVLPQTLAPAFPYVVRDVVGWGAYVRGGAEDAEVDAVMSQLGIADLADRAVTRLSGGQWARVRIAQAFLQRPAVLFADEPDAALDRSARHMLFNALAESHQTVVAVTHDLESARRYATHIIGLRDGQVAFHRDCADVSAEDCEALWD